MFISSIQNKPCIARRHRADPALFRAEFPPTMMTDVFWTELVVKGPHYDDCWIYLDLHSTRALNLSSCSMGTLKHLSGLIDSPELLCGGACVLFPTSRPPPKFHARPSRTRRALCDCVWRSWAQASHLGRV